VFGYFIIYFNARRFRFVANVAPQLAVRPVGHALVVDCTLVYAVGYIAHVANEQLADSAFHCPIHHFPADLVFDVAAAQFLSGEEAVLTPLQSFPAP
jgi:hypothetical protein